MTNGPNKWWLGPIKLYLNLKTESCFFLFMFICCNSNCNCLHSNTWMQPPLSHFLTLPSAPILSHVNQNYSACSPPKPKPTNGPHFHFVCLRQQVLVWSWKMISMLSCRYPLPLFNWVLDGFAFYGLLCILVQCYSLNDIFVCFSICDSIETV